MADPVTATMIIGTIAAVGGTTYSIIDSNRQAKKAEKRQAAYEQKLAAEQAAADAEEQRIKDETLARQKAYGASLIGDNTQLTNVLSSGGYSDEASDFSLLRTELGSSSVDEMFA